MAEISIALANVLKSYGKGAARIVAMDGLSLEVIRGEFTSLMGPSGSGKTTLLNVIAGLDAPDSGQVVVDGTDLATLSDSQLAALRLSTLGFVFQHFNLLPALSVERNVAWPLQFRGSSRADARRIALNTLRRVGLAERSAHYPAELSGGEQQRVAIARAIATRPLIVLADEPTGNLDSRTGQAILDLLRGLSLEDGITVVMVTHSPLAAACGDRTLELKDGRIVRDVRAPVQEPKVVSLHGDRT